jgi:hypothetical protein
MKRVQMLVGSLGAAAPILAMITPTVAQAATHPADQPNKSGGKTVSVLGAARSPAQAAATSSSTSFMGASPSVASSGSPDTVRCEGAKEYQKTKNDESLKFWSNPLGNPISYNCIGTVEGKWFNWSSKQHWVYRVKVYSDGDWTTPVYNKKTAGTKVNTHTIYGQQGIHKWYRAPVRVCDTWYSSVSPGSIAVICKTID